MQHAAAQLDVRAIYRQYARTHTYAGPAGKGGRNDVGKPPHTDEESDLLAVLDRYQTDNERKFLAATELLAIIKAMGYRRVAAPSPVVAAARGRIERILSASA